jgi:hypothetical protein
MQWAMLRLEDFRMRCGLVGSSWCRGAVVFRWSTCFEDEPAPGPARLRALVRVSEM